MSAMLYKSCILDGASKQYLMNDMKYLRVKANIILAVATYQRTENTFQQSQ